MISDEEWRDIKGYEGLYQVSNLGRVKSLHYGKEKIRKEIKELEELRRYLTIKKHLITANGMIEISVCIDVLKRLLEGE